MTNKILKINPNTEQVVGSFAADQDALRSHLSAGSKKLAFEALTIIKRMGKMDIDGHLFVLAKA